MNDDGFAEKTSIMQWAMFVSDSLHILTANEVATKSGESPWLMVNNRISNPIATNSYEERTTNLRDRYTRM